MKDIKTNRLFTSHFLKVFEKDGLIALAHQLHPEPVYLMGKLWRGITTSLANSAQLSVAHELLSDLISRKLLIGDHAIDQQELKLARDQCTQMLNRPTILYLMLAGGCNFSCRYCPIPALADRYGEQLLSFEDAAAGIRLWQRHIGEYPRDGAPYILIFYGGEPLLNRAVLERLLPYVADQRSVGLLPSELQLMLCTNGSLIDGRLSELLARFNVTVAVGVDGPQDHHDTVRLTGDGDSTFAVVEGAIRQLIISGVNVVASVTITPANADLLAEYAKFLRNLGITKFGFNLMKGKALIKALAGRSVEHYCRKAAQGVLTGLPDISRDGRFYEYQLEKKVVALQTGSPFSVDCTCYGNQIVIQPDGQVTNCPFLRSDQGHVRSLSDTFRIWSTDTVETWRRRLPIFNDSVSVDGGVLNGGGCAWSSHELHGSIAAEDSSNAIYTKEIVYELIWKLIPSERARALHQGEATHWSYRRVGTRRDSERDDS